MLCCIHFFPFAGVSAPCNKLILLLFRVRHSVVSAILWKKKKKENMTNWAGPCLVGVERRPRRRIREEALVRLTNHRGNPVIFPLNLSGEFFLYSSREK